MAVKIKDELVELIVNRIKIDKELLTEIEKSKLIQEKSEELLKDSRVRKAERLRSTHIFLHIIGIIASLIFFACFILGYLKVFDSASQPDAGIAFIALCATFIVGFQIFQAIEVNRRVAECEAMTLTLKETAEHFKHELTRLKNEVETTEVEGKYFNAYTISLTRAMQKSDFDVAEDIYYGWNALRAFNNALRYAALGGHSFAHSYNSFGRTIIPHCIKSIKNGYSTDNNWQQIADDFENHFNEIISLKLSNRKDEIARSKYVSMIESELIPFIKQKHLES